MDLFVSYDFVFSGIYIIPSNIRFNNVNAINLSDFYKNNRYDVVLLSNILDYVGSGRKMSLVSELDENLIADNENELNEYLKGISSTGDFDYYEIERILTQGKAEKEE